jgi:hypothetical protein
MKSYRAIFATIFLAASCVAADAASISTRGRYEFDQNMLRDPRALNWNIEQCSHYGLKPALLRKLAELMDVSPANARQGRYSLRGLCPVRAEAHYECGHSKGIAAFGHAYGKRETSATSVGRVSMRGTDWRMAKWHSGNAVNSDGGNALACHL